MPSAAIVVAAPIRKLCPEYSLQLSAAPPTYLRPAFAELVASYLQIRTMALMLALFLPNSSEQLPSSKAFSLSNL